jgi:hypothetical protein
VLQGRRTLPSREASESDESDGSQRGLIHSRRHAVIAVLITLVALASAFRSAVTRAPQNRWLFQPVNDSYLFGKPACIALSIFFWCFVAWILFWLYRATRDKNERFMVGGFAIGYVLGVIGGFLHVSAQINLEFASIAALLVSFASSLAILKNLSS